MRSFKQYLAETNFGGGDLSGQWTSRRLDAEFSGDPKILSFNDSGFGDEVPEMVAVPKSWSKREVSNWIQRHPYSPGKGRRAFPWGPEEVGREWAVWGVTWPVG